MRCDHGDIIERSEWATTTTTNYANDTTLSEQGGGTHPGSSGDATNRQPPTLMLATLTIAFDFLLFRWAFDIWLGILHFENRRLEKALTFSNTLEQRGLLSASSLHGVNGPGHLLFMLVDLCNVISVFVWRKEEVSQGVAYQHGCGVGSGDG